jgi:hypothetical protein
MPVRYEPKAALIETDLPDELVLLDPETQEMFSLNATGRLAWRALPGRSVAEVAALLADSFEVTAAEAEADVRALLQRLLAAGLLRESGAQA